MLYVVIKAAVMVVKQCMQPLPLRTVMVVKQCMQPLPLRTVR